MQSSGGTQHRDGRSCRGWRGRYEGRRTLHDRGWEPRTRDPAKVRCVCCRKAAGARMVGLGPRGPALRAGRLPGARGGSVPRKARWGEVEAPTARYAIYDAPRADDPLWKFGSSVIAYDAAAGLELPGLVPQGWTILARGYRGAAPLWVPCDVEGADAASAGVRRARIAERRRRVRATMPAVNIGVLEVARLGLSSRLCLGTIRRTSWPWRGL